MLYYNKGINQLFIFNNMLIIFNSNELPFNTVLGGWMVNGTTYDCGIFKRNVTIYISQ